jgi:hypothetical protein
MKKSSLLLVIALSLLTACNKSAAPAPASGATGPAVSSSPSSSPTSPDAVRQKLQEYSGASATDCGRLDVRANEAQSKAASECAMQASQGKKPFYVAYDMPGMIVGVAGNASGKLFTVQTQGTAAGAAVTSGDCPSQLRVANSGRVTCFAPGDMGSMSGSHTAGSVPSGMSNPHSKGTKPPSN